MKSIRRVVVEVGLLQGRRRILTLSCGHQKEVTAPHNEPLRIASTRCRICELVREYDGANLPTPLKHLHIEE